jgi:ubiquitin carboxyl-terminal hydrolase 48
LSQIQEELGIPALYQTLFYRGGELDDKWRSMEDIGLMVNDVLDLRQEVEDLDIFDEDADVLPKRPRRDTGVEGFGGTLLGGFSTDSSADDREMDGNDFPPESSSPPAAPVKSCPACTFENPLDEAQCEICAYKFGTE